MYRFIWIGSILVACISLQMLNFIASLFGVWTLLKIFDHSQHLFLFNHRFDVLHSVPILSLLHRVCNVLYFFVTDFNFVHQSLSVLFSDVPHSLNVLGLPFFDQPSLFIFEFFLHFFLSPFWVCFIEPLKDCFHPHLFFFNFLSFLEFDLTLFFDFSLSILL